MVKRLIATGLLLAVLAMPSFADTLVKTFQYGSRTIVITVTYTDFNGNGRIDSIKELRSITSIQVSFAQPA